MFNHPTQIYHRSTPKVHIIIDIEKDQFSGILDDNFPHEIYRIRRLDHKM
jgi:hypothetical protein